MTEPRRRPEFVWGGNIHGLRVDVSAAGEIFISEQSIEATRGTVPPEAFAELTEKWERLDAFADRVEKLAAEWRTIVDGAAPADATTH